MASYEYIEHTADVLFKAKGKSLGELFEQCGLATEEAQVELGNVTQDVEKKINLEGKKIDLLLFDFLDDLVFYKDSEQLIFSKFSCKVEEVDEGYQLTCTAYGEKLSEKHEQKVDVKAVTMHLFEVKKVEDGWEAKVLLDI